MDTEDLIRELNNAGTRLVSNVPLLTGVNLVLALYGGLVSPALPRVICTMYQYPIFRLAIFFLIAYLSVNNISTAIMVATIVFIGLQQLNAYKFDDVMAGSACGAYVTQGKAKN